MTTKCIVIITAIVPGFFQPAVNPVFAQADSSIPEQKLERLETAGRYVPKQYAVMPFAIRADASVATLADKWISLVSGEIADKMEEFGGARRIAISASAVRAMRESIEGRRHFTDTEVKEYLDRFIVPEFYDSIHARSVQTGEELLDDQQKNSFITDKAKQSAVTGDERAIVDNSGFILLPWVINYSESKSDKGYWFCNLGIGVLVYSVHGSSGRGEATLRATPYDKSAMVPGDSLLDSAFAYAVRNAVSGCFINLESVSSDFRVTSQVLDHGVNSVTFPLHVKQQDWMKTDTRVQFVQNETGRDGRVTRKNNGWGIVIKKTGAVSAGDPVFKAQVIAGFPATGTIVEEIKTSGGEADLGWSVMPFRFRTNHDSLWSDQSGSTVVIDNLESGMNTLQMPEILSFGYALGRNNPVLRQTFFNFNVSLMWFNPDFGNGSIVMRKTPADAPDTCFSAGNGFWMGLGIGLSKRLYFRRFAVKPFVGLDYSFIDYDFASSRSDTLSVLFGNPMVTGGSDFEIALLPYLSVGVSAWYRKGFPFIWSLSYRNANPIYVKAQTNEFVPSIEGVGYTFHITCLF